MYKKTDIVKLILDQDQKHDTNFKGIFKFNNIDFIIDKILVDYIAISKVKENIGHIFDLDPEISDYYRCYLFIPYINDDIIPQLIDEIKLRKEIIKTIDLCIPSVNFYIDNCNIVISNNAFTNCDKCCNPFLHKCNDQFVIFSTVDCKINCIYNNIDLSFGSIKELLLNPYFRLFINVSQKIAFQNYDLE